MMRETDRFYLNKEEPNKSCLLALRSMILQQDPGITETQKYGMPCKSTNYRRIFISHLKHLKAMGELKLDYDVL